MDEKIEIPRWLCYRIETICECEGRENSWVKDMMKKLEKEILVLICKLEKKNFL
jgi:hypothetical protein